MPKVDVIQTSFTAGEFGPSLFGRTDIIQYANACAIVQNMIPRTYGPAITTPGTTYIGTVSNSTLPTRLIKFVFSRTNSYIIEMGKYYFKFYTNGGVVVTTGTTPFVLAHIYDETEVFDVQYTQLNDVIWLTHKDHPPQKLVRLAAANWTIADAPTEGGPFLDENTPALTSTNVSASTITITPSATTGTINITVSPTNSSLFTVSGSTLGHHGAYWMIGGLGAATATNATTGLQELGYVRIDYVTNSYTATATVIKNLNVATATTIWAEGAFSAVRGYPARVTFHERRLYYARTDFQPQNEWGSKIFKYDDFTLDTQTDEDGLNLPLAANESNEILWLASGKSLIAGTFGGAFVTNSGSAEAITPDNATASEQVGYGADAIVPRKIGSFLYYVQKFGRKLREMYYNFDTDSFKAVDKTVLSPHILGNGIVDMDVQNNPESILYCVLTSGTLATMTRETDQEVTGWARQTTNGTYTSVAVIPSQSNLYDEVWVIVERWVNGVQKKYIEQFDSIEPPARQDLCNYLHSSLLYNAYTSTSSATLTMSLAGTSGTGVTVTSSGAVFVAGDVGQRIRAIDADGVNLGTGLITSYTSSTVVNVSVTKTFSSLSYAVNKWGISVNTLSGLDHLETEEVNVLADGGTDYPVKTVATGVITLASDYFVVRAGLAYSQILKTLPKEAGSARGTAQGKKQRIEEVSFKLNRSHKGFKVGSGPSNLDQVGTRDPSTPFGTPELLFTGVFPNDETGAGFQLQNDYKYGSQVYIQNDDPLPMEILAIIMNMETFDR
jgi:hypothetical protein